jgi:pantoate--beta-alanine ligase
VRVVTSPAAMREARRKLPSPVGLVPTMGYLHDGHLSLVQRARSECASVVVSIFVNPSQFGPGEDLEAYPRDLHADLGMLDAEKVDLVWTPSSEDMYPAGYQTWVTLGTLTERLEGAHRPGHFRGVATIVTKLLNGVEPQSVYFGQKDAQQALVVRRMTRDLNMPVRMVICPTVREPDGLAMSSRNGYLDAEQRKSATVLYRSLRAAADAYANGTADAERLRQIMRDELSRSPAARVQYVSVADPESLDELSGTVSRALLSMAVFIGETRLIDNLLLGQETL